MEIQKFIENMVAVFEDTDPAIIKAETRFKDVEGYSSLIALSIIAMIDEEYDVKIKGNDIRSSSTIEDLFKIVYSRI